MVRVYVKVQCGGLVLRLDKQTGIVALLSEFNGSAKCAILVRLVTMIFLTLLRRVAIRRCRRTSFAGTSFVIVIYTRQRRAPPRRRRRL